MLRTVGKKDRGVEVGVRKLGMGVLAVVFPLALFEFALAALDYHYYPPLVVPLWGGRNDREMLSRDGRYQPHPYWFWELRPGALLDAATGETVSASGLRGLEPEARPRPGRLRVAALGDSSTFGLGVEARETFARRLEELAPLEVLNFGVPGHNAFQGLELYRGRVRDFDPAVVLAAFGAINEASPRDPNSDERFAITSRASPGAARISNALMRFRFYQLLRAGIAGMRGENLAAQEARERFFENLERRERGEPYKRNVDVPTFRRVLLELARLTAEDGARLILIGPPRSRDQERRLPELLEYSTALVEIAQEAGVPFCDVRLAFRASRDPRLLRDGVHPSGRGHKVYASSLLGCLEREGLLAGQPLAGDRP